MPEHEMTTPRFSPAVAGDPSRAGIPFSERVKTVAENIRLSPASSDLQVPYRINRSEKLHTTHPPIPTPAV